MNVSYPAPVTQSEGKRRPRLIRRLALCALSLMAMSLGAEAREEAVNAGNLGMVFYPQGLLATTGDGQWTERGADGEIRSRLVETGRSWEAVQLKDYERQLELELNLSHDYIFFLNPGTDKTPLHRITRTKSVRDSAYYQVLVRIKGADKCLEAARSTGSVRRASDDTSVPVQRFDPVFVNCNDSLGQRWSIAPGEDFNGGPTYFWRNLSVEYAGLDLCLTSRGHGGFLAMTQCRDVREQRWLHQNPPAVQVRHLRSLNEPKTWCMVLNTVDGPALLGDTTYRAYSPDHLPKIAADCQDGDSGPVPTVRFQRLPM